MPHNNSQPGKPSIVEIVVMVILFLWIASLPSTGNGPHRAARADRHLSYRLHSQLDAWMQSGFHSRSLGTVYRHLHAGIAGPE